LWWSGKQYFSWWTELTVSLSSIFTVTADDQALDSDEASLLIAIIED
jgi:hypothetical protein